MAKMMLLPHFTLKHSQRATHNHKTVKILHISIPMTILHQMISVIVTHNFKDNRDNKILIFQCKWPQDSIC